VEPVITTYTGKVICPLNLQPEDISIEDIAIGCSNICRFGGLVRPFYSLAAHHILCERILRDMGCSWQLCLAAALHDACEVYSPISDCVKPCKNNFAVSLLPNGEIVSLNEYEDRLLNVISKKIGLNLEWNSPHVKYADKVALNSESYHLRGFKIFEDLPIHEVKSLTPEKGYIEYKSLLLEYGLVTN
jgi:hypothetical protein